MRHSMCKPVQIWSKDLFECDDVHIYLSLSNSFIYCCIHTIIRLSHTHEEVFAVVPLIQYYHSLFAAFLTAIKLILFAFLTT